MLATVVSRQIARLGAALTIVTLGLAGCGSSGGSSSSAASSSSGGKITANKVDTIANEVPAAVKTKGTLTIATDASYAPNEFVGPDGTTIVGMDPDLAAAIGAVTGLKVSVTNVKFDNILPGIQGGKYDLGMSSFNDNKEREQVVDFVTYFSAGTSFFIKKGGPSITKLDDLCGHKVSVETGTIQETDANAQKAKCSGAGKPDVTVSSFPDQSGANLALQSGRVEVSMADSPVAAYQVQQSNGQFQTSGEPYGTGPYGIALPKNNGMGKAILDAIKELMSDGVYANILSKWGVSSGAINNPGINKAG
ncbi:MAG: ABC transporter substrate-binding protein [Candidatus Dormibacteria bacterium]